MSLALCPHFNMAQWVKPLPWGLHILPMFYSGFLPHSKDLLVRLKGVSELPMVFECLPFSGLASHPGDSLPGIASMVSTAPYWISSWEMD